MGRVVSLSLVLAKHRRNTSPAVSSLLHNALRYDMNTEKCYWRHPCYWEHPQKLARLRASRTTFQTMTIKEVQYITNRPLFFPYKVLLSQILISGFFFPFLKKENLEKLLQQNTLKVNICLKATSKIGQVRGFQHARSTPNSTGAVGRAKYTQNTSQLPAQGTQPSQATAKASL